MNKICEFCHNQFISKTNRSKYICCSRCKSIAAHYTMHGDGQDKHKFFLSKQKFNEKRLNLIDINLTKKTFGYLPSDLSIGSAKLVIARCEFCSNILETKFHNVLHRGNNLCCRSCIGIASVYDGRIPPGEFYKSKRSNINLSNIDAEATLSAYGNEVKGILPFSNKKVIAKCKWCNGSISVRMSTLSYQNGSVCCRKCMKLETVETLKKRYGVSTVLDIDSVKLAYKNSSIEKVIAKVLTKRYGVKYENPFTIDAGSFQYSFDFYIPVANLLIECQGDYFHDFKKNGYTGTPKDRSKASYVKNNTSYQLIHIWEHEIHLGRIHKILDHFIHPATVPCIELNNLNDLVFSVIQLDAADEFMQRYHYLGGIGSNSVCIGGYLSDELIVVISFGGTTRQTSIDKLSAHIGTVTSSEVFELRRFCIRPNVKSSNLASFSISKSLSVLKRTNTKIKYIISFSDSTVGDIGTIYKASSWTRLKDTSTSYHYFDSKTLNSIHKKTVWNISQRAKLSERDFVDKAGLVRVNEGIKSVWLKVL